MAATYMIGVDIGTQGTKTVLMKSDGTVMADAFERSDIQHGTDGAITENPETQLTSVLRTIKECVSKSGVKNTQVSGIGIDGQMAGITAVDKDGRNCIPYDSWLDTRCSPYIDAMQSRAGDQILQKTGVVPSLNHGPKILWWKHEHPDIFGKIYKFVQPGSYAAMRLCGLTGSNGYIDGTYLHFSGFADNANSRWDDELCEVFGVPAEKLPSIRKSTEQIGAITREMAQLSGLQEGTPVAAGCGDTAASFLSSGAYSEGTTVDVAGTASVLASTTSEFNPDVKNKVLGVGQSTIPGLWHPYAYINGGGLNLEWFKNLVNEQRTEEMSFDDLEEQAETVTIGRYSPIFVPHMSGRVMPSDASMRGTWFGLTRDVGVGALYVSLLEGVALEYRLYVSALRELYPEVHFGEMRVTGGGETSRLWNQMKATICDVDVKRVLTSRGAPMGSAMVAGCAAGIWDSPIEPAKDWLSFEAAATPEPHKETLVEHRFRDYSNALSFASLYSRRLKEEEENDS